MNYQRVIDKETSVKTIGVIKEPTATQSGVCDFTYRDQYSVFDWGKMPMPNGKAMDNRPVALMAAFNHEMLAHQGIPVCYMGAVAEDGTVQSMEWFRAQGKVPRTLRMRMVNIFKPSFDPKTGKWDYSTFQNPPANNYVHPIEFIWRQEAGPDSSFWKNVAKGNYKPSDFGLPERLKPGDSFPFPVLDHSSKYEPHDRYFSPQIAQQLAAIPKDRWEAMCEMRQKMNISLSGYAGRLGLRRPDGKQEMLVFVEGGKTRDMLADVAGTPHEDRIEYLTESGIWVKSSKQTPRDYNKLLNPKWAKQCEEAKARAEREGLPNWKELVTERPIPLEPMFFEQYNNMMRALANTWVGWSALPASSLEEACTEFNAYLADYKKRLQPKAA